MVSASVEVELHPGGSVLQLECAPIISGLDHYSVVLGVKVQSAYRTGTGHLYEIGFVPSANCVLVLIMLISLLNTD